MNSLHRKITTVSFRPEWMPIFLFGLCILSYGLLIKQLGFYSDDWQMIWLAKRMNALGKFFQNNRPQLGMLYQISYNLIGSSPVAWHVFGIFGRWVCACSFWLMLSLTWPGQKNITTWASFLFVVYPGFALQFISMVFGHGFLLFASLLLSLSFTILGIRFPKHTWWLTVLALLTSWINLIAAEYFFTLELLRPILIWIVLANSGWVIRKERLRRTLWVWLPYLGLFVAVVVWRIFHFSDLTKYDLVSGENLTFNPMLEVWYLVKNVFTDIFMTSFGAWGYAILRLFSFNPFKTAYGRAFLGVFAAAALLVGLISYRMQGTKPDPLSNTRQRDFWQLLGVAVLALFLAGWPFWLSHLDVSLTFFRSRFTLPFMLGASLLAPVLILKIPARWWIHLVVLSGMVGLAAGYQFRLAETFRREWVRQKEILWQMSWRIPRLEEGTAIFADVIPMDFESDNAFSAAVKWVYTAEPVVETNPYVVYEMRLRLGTLFEHLEPNQPIREWNTNRSISIAMASQGCMRVLDPYLESNNPDLDIEMRKAASLSNLDLILPAISQPAVRPPEDIFGAEPAHDWCYYFEKADLANQNGDWRQATSLGDEAFAKGYAPFFPQELIPFIQGYAHTGQWVRAAELTRQANLENLTCLIWDRISDTTADSPEKTALLSELREQYSCPSVPPRE